MKSCLRAGFDFAARLSTYKLVYNHFAGDFYRGNFDVEGKFHSRAIVLQVEVRDIADREGCGLRDHARSI